MPYYLNMSNGSDSHSDLILFHWRTLPYHSLHHLSVWCKQMCLLQPKWSDWLNFCWANLACDFRQHWQQLVWLLLVVSRGGYVNWPVIGFNWLNFTELLNTIHYISRSAIAGEMYCEALRLCVCVCVSVRLCISMLLDGFFWNSVHMLGVPPSCACWKDIFWSAGPGPPGGGALFLKNRSFSM